MPSSEWALEPSGDGYGIKTQQDFHNVLRARQKRRKTAVRTAFQDPGSAHSGDSGGDAQNENANPSGTMEVVKGSPISIVRNDYLQHHINTGLRPQNFIRESILANRYSEHPKLASLTHLKESVVKDYATPPMYIRANLRENPLGKLMGGLKFDVILVDPPLKEYCEWSPPTLTDCPDPIRPYWTWEEIAALKIEEVAATPSFIFVWVGNREGLDRGRDLLYKLGFRRCEDISWIKTNKSWEGTPLMAPPSVLQQTKEHCLMGIKGTVRRATDGHFIHCNVDTDVIIAEEPADHSTKKPDELYHLIERFCMGRRRLELFGNDDNIRPGWVTVGLGISTTNWDKEKYQSWFRSGVDPDSSVKGGSLVATTTEIETLRPKSPPNVMRKGPRRPGM